MSVFSTYDDWKTRDDSFDHEEPPQQWFTCDACDGSGEIITAHWGCEPGCGHPHMIEDGEPCGKCNGEGGWLDDAEYDQ